MIFIVIYGSKINIVGFWTLGYTLFCTLGIFLCFLSQTIAQMIEEMCKKYVKCHYYFASKRRFDGDVRGNLLGDEKKYCQLSKEIVIESINV